MEALLSLVLGKAGGYLVGAGAILIAFIATYVRGRLSGAKLERQKHAAEDARARDIRDQVDNDIGAMPADAARKELGKWARR
jgi:hypothetical protein